MDTLDFNMEPLRLAEPITHGEDLGGRGFGGNGGLDGTFRGGLGGHALQDVELTWNEREGLCTVRR